MVALGIMKKRFYRKSILFILYSILCGYTLGIWIHSIGIARPESNLPSMINGTANKPYVYRVLLPLSIGLIKKGIPLPVWDRLEDGINKVVPSSKIESLLHWKTDFLSEYLIALFLIYLSLLGFTFALKYLLTINYLTSEIVTEMVPACALLFIPGFLGYYHGYIYDFPSLFLFTLGLIFLKKSKWNYFYLIFLLGNLNKETIILLTLIFAIYEKGRIETVSYLSHLSLQLGIFVLVRLCLLFIFRDNPGSTVEFHFFDNIIFLLQPYRFTKILTWMLIIVGIFYNWSLKPRFLKQAVIIIVPLLLLTLFLGWIIELRDYYEAFPICFLLISHTFIKSVLGCKMEAVDY